jgi:predicted O-methyltransferase YrrM
MSTNEYGDQALPKQFDGTKLNKPNWDKIYPVPEEFPYLDGVRCMTNLCDLHDLAEVASQVQFGDILEIGSAFGASTLAIASRTSRNVFACDPQSNPAAVKTKRFEAFLGNCQRSGFGNRIFPLRMMSRQAFPVLREHGIVLGMVFVDGFHSPGLAIKDYNDAFDYLPLGGLICAHDMTSAFENLAEATLKWIDRMEDYIHVLKNPYPANRGIEQTETSALLILQKTRLK